MIRPLIDRPFIPQEVEKLSQPKRKRFADAPMTNALILGPRQPSKEGLVENPIMYNTVIEKHSTVVTHPTPQPTNYATNPLTASAFSVDPKELEIQKLSPGSYSTPVKIDGSAFNDPTLSGYEAPNFIHKGEKQIPNKNIHAPANINGVNAQMQSSIQQDIEKFISQFDNAKDKAERTKVLLEGKHRLSAEAKQLSMVVQAELKELLAAKELAVKMNSVLNNYEHKLKADAMAHLKLADIVTVKNLLRDKLQREMQGFRTSPAEFQELEKINPVDIQNIIHEIKLKIGE